MTLIVSASGIRGTVEGPSGDNLTPVEVVSWVGAWGQWMRSQYGPARLLVGQDARPSGEVLRPLAVQTLRALGHTVYDAGLTTTPSLSMAIPFYEAKGGLILTASHNPPGWNALKFLDEKGEFLPPQAIQAIAQVRETLNFPATDHPAPLECAEATLTHHLTSLLRHPWVDREAIEKQRFRIVVDGCNSGGGLFVPALLEALGVESVIRLNCEPTGRFARPPEPLPENLTELAERVRQTNAHLGIAVDPDVDRVVFILPNGKPFGEEYTLVATADYALSRQSGPIVANLSTTLAVRWVAERYGVPFYESRVGEYYVVQMMKAVGATFGGEGNGGVILPSLHYGRDALAGVALFLSYLARMGGDAIKLRAQYPDLAITKGKVPLSDRGLSPDIWDKLRSQAPEAESNIEDGLKLRWADRWVHIRISGTEPIIRIIAEAPTIHEANALRAHWESTLRSIL
ncbi:MAG: phosphoglucosamine mutase [Bacteroidia bacterium]|nr:phosphoglucosamine mutase [Bacteroidia bacterium]